MGGAKMKKNTNSSGHTQTPMAQATTATPAPSHETTESHMITAGSFKVDRSTLCNVTDISLDQSEVEVPLPCTPGGVNGGEMGTSQVAPPSNRSESANSSISGRFAEAWSRTFARSNPPQPEVDVSRVPQRFIAACKGDAKKAHAMHQAMLKWREDNAIDTILTRPFAAWDVIKACDPQCLHLRGLHGEIVSIENPGKLDTDRLKAANITPERMGLYLAFWSEFLFTKLDPREEAQYITIMDLKGISLSKLASRDVLAIIQAQSEVMDKYYPGRSKKILIVNPPMLFGPVFKLIKAVLPGGVDDSIDIVQLSELTKYVAADQLPEHLGGTSQVPLGEADDEEALTSHLKGLDATQT